MLGRARAEQTFTLSAELVAGLHGVAEECGASLTLVLLAAYQTFLSRHGGCSEFALTLLGPTLGGRDGDPGRALALHCSIALESSFEELVARVKDELERAPAAAFPSLHVDEGGAIAVAAFVVRRAPDAKGTLDAAVRAAELTLRLHLDDEVECHFVYARELFERESVARMADSFLTLLASVARAPAQPVGRLSLLHERELSALRAFNQTELSLPPVGGFHHLVLAQAARTPERVAVIDAAGEQSYGELARAAQRWSAQLAGLGISRGARVGVALGRSRRALEAVLGVLSAGATYVPLDPGFPSDRLAFMIEDAGLAAVITEEATHSLLPPGAHTLLIAEQVERAALEPSRALVAGAADDVAYVLYTSGSTGRPKGVQVTHENVVNFLIGAAREPGIDRDDRVLAVSTFSFDISILELFLPLTVGACTMLGPRMCAADGATLARYIDDFGATFVQATPTTFGLLVQAGVPRRRFKALVGGEAFPPRLAGELAACCSEIWNCYGPTETTIWSSFQRIEPDAPIGIGRPMANTRMYVLDALGQPVPMGVAGELYIGGLGVSRGYLNRPELDAERFLPDPFGQSAGARMYRTGDLARLRPSGLVYLGRVDTQVKLRGYRIELGEIESVLSAHDAVEACAVAVRELAADDQRLIAYFVRAGKREASLEQLSRHLSQRLPSYMVPRFIMELPELPMTPSGKLDRKRLPDPRGHEVAPQAGRVLPRNATERALTEVWRSLLGVGGVGIEDDFFALGGHSLLAVQLVQQLNGAFRTSLPLSFAFEAPTIRAQAERIDLGAHGGGVSAIPLKSGVGQPLFCVCGINLYQSLAERVRSERPVYGLFLPVEAELLEDATIRLDARAMARQYVEVLRSVQPHGPYYLTGVSFGGVLAYEIARQLRADGERVSLLALLDVVLPVARRPRGRLRLGRIATRLSLGLRGVVGRLRRLQRRDARRDPALLAAAEDWAALQAYRDERYDAATADYVAELPPYDGDVLLVRAREQVKSMPGCAIDYGWSEFVEGQLTCVDIPGDHLGILTEPYVDELAGILSTFL